MLGCKWHSCAVAEALIQHGMVPISPPNIWEVLAKLHVLWMGIWRHILPITITITTTWVVPDLGGLLKFWFTAGLQMTPLCSGWGSNPTWNGSNISSQHMRGAWQASYAVDGRMTPYSAHYQYHHLSCPRFGKSSEIMVHCWVTKQMTPLCSG